MSDHMTRIRQLAIQSSGYTEAEFDFSLANNRKPPTPEPVESLGARAMLAAVVHQVANEAHPHQPGDADERQARADALMQELLPEVEQMVTAAKARKYTGWSASAQDRGQRVEYAD